MKVTTIGSFDIIHHGHLKFFERCAAIANDKIYVGVNSDEFIAGYKKQLPAMTYDERRQVIESLPYVKRVIKNEQEDGTCKKLILGLNTELLVIGSDWGRKDYLEQIGVSWDWLDKYHVGLCYLPYTWGVSSSDIRKRING